MYKDEAKAILDSREATYGDRVRNMDAAAGMVEAYLVGVDQREDTTLTGADFAMIMVLYKIYRFAVTPDYQDNLDDAEGYLKIVRECLADQLIEAKTAEDYQRIKRERALAEHPASGTTEKKAEEAAMNAWEEQRLRGAQNLFKMQAQEQSFKEQQDRIVEERLARGLQEDIQREKAESEAESQTIMEERRIWRKNRSDG